MIAFGIIILFLVIKNHVLSFQTKGFYTKKFNLNNTETIRDLGNFEVLKFSTEEIIIQKREGVDQAFIPHHHYLFNVEGKDYIFTFESLLEKDDLIILDYIVWFYTKPLVYTAKVNISEVALVENPHHTNYTIHLITEDFGCCLLEGKKFRYNWVKRNQNIGFVGKNRDLFGYHYTHSASLESGVRSSFPFEDFNATHTLLWLGRSNFSRSTNEIVAEIEAIAEEVSLANPNTLVVVLTPAPSPQLSIDATIQQVVNRLVANEKLSIIDINALIKTQKNWKTRLFFEDYGLNEKAYDLILNHLNEQLF